MTRRSLRTLAVLAVLAAGPAACSSGGPASPAASAGGTSTDVQKALDAGRRFAQCGRDHGLPDFPDPELYAGRIGYFHAPQEVKDQEEQVLDIPECKAILSEIPVLPDDHPPPSAADMRKLREFAKCIREHGVPDWRWRPCPLRTVHPKPHPSMIHHRAGHLARPAALSGRSAGRRDGILTPRLGLRSVTA